MEKIILEYDDKTMLVEVSFKEGETGEVHSHPHTQFTYITEGKFEFEKDKEKFLVTKGDSLYFEPYCEHGVICLNEGKLLDVFSPIREDFLKEV